MSPAPASPASQCDTCPTCHGARRLPDPFGYTLDGIPAVYLDCPTCADPRCPACGYWLNDGQCWFCGHKPQAA